ncbi:lipoyl(octanoyl) transferase LipB [Marinobacter salinexigens]|uniref:Octanoyltransferase n=1 Tax=Marinobacter salinexigens TaxID=2919747 RepID=A0A5B0VES0_9GAMM|nr:lipoyl(octanoyl) transferase LipB [Marinobacter salinexigens]KAA1173166.1 lipoyl(octanoyl) transferase LipB [Marinobacter salinexigens]
MTDLVVRSLGEQPYEETWEAMKSFTAERDESVCDELWCLEHPRVYTQGQAGKAEHILAPGDIPVIQVDRGGQVTYHGPGQLVIYLMIDLSRRKLGIRALVDVIEKAIVGTLAELGVEAAPRPDAPGVYVGESKIASLGLRVRRGCSFHGLALNVDMDMEPFRRINPCGYAGMPMSQVTDFVPGAALEDIERRLVGQLVEKLGCNEGSVEYRQGW